MGPSPAVEPPVAIEIDSGEEFDVLETDQARAAEYNAAVPPALLPVKIEAPEVSLAGQAGGSSGIVGPGFAVVPPTSYVAPPPGAPPVTSQAPPPPADAQVKQEFELLPPPIGRGDFIAENLGVPISMEELRSRLVELEVQTLSSVPLPADDARSATTSLAHAKLEELLERRFKGLTRRSGHFVHASSAL